MEIWFWMGMVATLATVAGLGAWAGKQVKSSRDFLVGGRGMGPALVAGSLLGTIFGGSATLGTVEMACKLGLSAWWWTLGCGIGVVILVLVLPGELRRREVWTIPEYLGKVFGNGIRIVSAVIMIAAVFISLIPQTLTCFSILLTLAAARWAVAAITAGVIIAYVVFGGVWGASIVGLFKVGLLVITFLCASVVAWRATGGPATLLRALPTRPWFSLFGRGVSVDLGSGIGTVLGVISSQVYAQTLLAARDRKAAVTGAIIAAITGSTLGLMGVYTGLSLKIMDPSISSSKALPLFIVKYFPPPVAGVLLGGVFIGSVGAAAGIALGTGTLISRDILEAVIERLKSPAARLLATRASVLAVILGSVGISLALEPSFVLEYSFLSMNLRGAAVTLPFLAATACRLKMTRSGGLACMSTGTASVLLLSALTPGRDPLIPATLMALAALFGAPVVERWVQGIKVRAK